MLGVLGLSPSLLKRGVRGEGTLLFKLALILAQLAEDLCSLLPLELLVLLDERETEYGCDLTDPPEKLRLCRAGAGVPSASNKRASSAFRRMLEVSDDLARRAGVEYRSIFSALMFRGARARGAAGTDGAGGRGMRGGGMLKPSTARPMPSPSAETWRGRL